MLFNEVYSSYFGAVAEIIGIAVQGELTKEKIYEVVQRKGFAESTLTIPQNITDGTWPFLRNDLSTPLRNAPTMPLTVLQKRWLKALLSDPRIKLFDVPEMGLDDVEPLYTEDTFVYYDRYENGDPFDDPAYIEHFKTILTALKEKRKLRIRFKGHAGTKNSWICIPCWLEYSSKDNKFRLITANEKKRLTINVERIRSCKLLDHYDSEEWSIPPARKAYVELELWDQRNALERVMLHFSHFEKQVERISDNTYRLKLHYERDDETELVIRILSFGPVLRVIGPKDFKKKISERSEKQMKLRA